MGGWRAGGGGWVFLVALLNLENVTAGSYLITGVGQGAGGGGLTRAAPGGNEESL